MNKLDKKELERRKEILYNWWWDMSFKQKRYIKIGDRKSYPLKGIILDSKDEILLKDNIPLFSHIQIQTIQFCNLKCSFCPNHYMIWDRIDNKKRGIPYNSMSFKNYEKIMINLKELGYKGRVSPYLMNESLVDKDRIVEFIKITRKYLPQSEIVINTNATFLNKKILIDMIEAGLNRLCIDDYFGEKNRENLTRLLVSVCESTNYEKWPYEGMCEVELAGMIPNLKQIKSPTTDKENNIIRNERGNPIATDEKMIFPYTYWNRGGLLNLNSDIQVPQKDCNYPSKQMFINWKGDSLLCCCDWEEMVIMGNIIEDNIEKVWTNDKFQHYRSTLKKGERKKLKLCENCNYKGCENEDDRTIYDKLDVVVKTTGLFKG